MAYTLRNFSASFFIIKAFRISLTVFFSSSLNLSTASNRIFRSSLVLPCSLLISSLSVIPNAIDSFSRVFTAGSDLPVSYFLICSIFIPEIFDRSPWVHHLILLSSFNFLSIAIFLSFISPMFFNDTSYFRNYL